MTHGMSGTTQPSTTNYCGKCGKPFWYVGDCFDPNMICQCEKVYGNEDYSFQYIKKSEEIKLLEEILDILKKIERKLY